MKLHDHDEFEIYGEHLKGKRIALVITGGIAAYTSPKIIRALRRYSCDVFPYVTEAGLEFVTPQVLAWASQHQAVTKLTDKSEHLGQDGETFDAVVVYPATYDFISKMAMGIADDACSSLIASHLSHAKILYFPTMHGNMYRSPILHDNMARLDLLSNVVRVHPRLENDKANVHDTATTVCRIVREMSESSMRGVKVLVTAGCTPVKIDNVRRITNKFGGRLGIEIANELYLKGADVMLLQSKSGVRPPVYIPHRLFDDYSEYKRLAVDLAPMYPYGIFSAAVADYMPKTVVEGKIPSKGALTCIELVNTEKVIDLVRNAAPTMALISFKYEENKGLDYLLDVATKRLNGGHHLLVANDICLNTEKQKAFVCGLDEFKRAKVLDVGNGKTDIARRLVRILEKDDGER